MSTTFEHIDPSTLPEEWRKSLRLKPGQKVSVTVEAEATKRKFDRAAVEAILADMRKLPILDHRSPDEIIGYDEYGLPK